MQQEKFSYVQAFITQWYLFTLSVAKDKETWINQYTCPCRGHSLMGEDGHF